MFQKGKQTVSEAKFAFDDSGLLHKQQAWGLYNTEYARVIATDYVDYAVLYKCLPGQYAENALDGVK